MVSSQVVAAQTSTLGNLVLSHHLVFLSASILSLINKMVITKPTVASARLLGLGSKLYLSNMPRMLNKDFTQFIQSPS